MCFLGTEFGQYISSCVWVLIHLSWSVIGGHTKTRDPRDESLVRRDVGWARLRVPILLSKLHSGSPELLSPTHQGCSFSLKLYVNLVNDAMEVPCMVVYLSAVASLVHAHDREEFGRISFCRPLTVLG
jgi:hypothetical protein